MTQPAFSSLDTRALAAVSGGQQAAPDFFDWWRDVPPPISNPDSPMGSADGLAGRSFCERRPRLCAEMGLLPPKRSGPEAGPLGSMTRER